jgi:hypothetical protein
VFRQITRNLAGRMAPALRARQRRDQEFFLTQLVVVPIICRTIDNYCKTLVSVPLLIYRALWPCAKDSRGGRILKWGGAREKGSTAP